MRIGTIALTALLAVTAGIAGGTRTMAANDETILEYDDTATLGGGCFWCLEADFDTLDGVISTTSGYTGGHTVNPTYKEMVQGTNGHTEAVRLEYDPARVTYEELLEFFWRQIDPTVADRQFCDVGPQYRAAIFAHDDEQMQAALRSKEALARSKPFPGKIVTEIVPAGTFYRAEDYHQDYATEHPIRYRYYRSRCGRDARLRELWGDETR